MIRRIILISIALIIPMMSSAQKMLTASGEYTYYAPNNITIDQAKAIAVERTKNQIIADHFGTVMGVNNSTVVSNKNGDSSVSFLSIGESEVKGEWIETVGEPKISVSYEQNMIVVNVRMKGTIREIKSARIPFKVLILKNGIEDRFESNEYHDGDHLYISFETPISGYVAVYLYDQSGSQFVESDKRTVFFAHKKSQYSVELNKQIESLYSEYTLYCSEDNEVNRIYVIFSPNKFSRPIDNTSTEYDMPAMLTFEAFQTWLAKSRKQDVDMCVRIQDIIIKK